MDRLEGTGKIEGQYVGSFPTDKEEVRSISYGPKGRRDYVTLGGCAVQVQMLAW